MINAAVSILLGTTTKLDKWTYSNAWIKNYTYNVSASDELWRTTALLKNDSKLCTSVTHFV